MISFDSIIAFIKVVETSNFRIAAEELGVSTTAVSRKISQLEKNLNIQLLERTTRKVSLTDPGEFYYNQCKIVIAQLEEAESLISQLKTEPSGELRVLARSTFFDKFIMPHIQEFRELYPKICLDIQFIETQVTLDDSVDLIFGVVAEGKPDWVRRKLMEAQYTLCASPEYLSKFGEPKSPIEVKNHRFIGTKLRDPHNAIRFKDDELITVDPVMYIRNSEAMLGCALQGIGIVSMLDYYVQPSLQQGLLKEILPAHKPPKQGLFLYYQQRRFVHVKIRKFIDFVLEKNDFTFSS